MRRLLAASIALVSFFMSGQSVEAAPIPLSLQEFVVGGSVGRVSLGYYSTNLAYSSGGGSIEFAGWSLGFTSSDNQTPAAAPQYPINTEFGLMVGTPAPGSTNNFEGPVLDISGQVTGLLTGPGNGNWRWSGSYSGTATSVTLSPGYSQDTSQLPTPLLDILNHPDHFHINAVVGGGNYNFLDVTLTFDPPSPTEFPEPTAFVTLVVGSVAVILRRRIG
jgi:hypothetical protein